jgi:hypothetical protein
LAELAPPLFQPPWPGHWLQRPNGLKP